MYACIQAGGSQHTVSPGDVIRVQKMDQNGDEKEVRLGNVLLVATDDRILVGNPYVADASVKAEILGMVKAPRVLVYKQRPRKNYRKLRGHRQCYTVLKIQEITVGGQHGT